MIYLSLVIALGIGYVIGIFQNGINVHHFNYDHLDVDEPKKPHSSYGIQEYMNYHDKTDGMNDF